MPRHTQLPISDEHLTSGQLLSLLGIHLAALQASVHDLNGPLSACRGYTDLSLHILCSDQFSSTTSKISQLNELIPNIAHGLVRLGTIIEKHFSRQKAGDYHPMFVTKPINLTREIAALLSPAEIRVAHSSPRSLVILYPCAALFSALWELVKNAVDHSRGNVRVLIRWRTHGQRFECEVHDNGPGIVEPQQRGFLPMDCLPECVSRKGEPREGLRAVDRIVRASGGLLLFGRSRFRGGTVVRFEVPILGSHQSRGTSEELR